MVENETVRLEIADSNLSFIADKHILHSTSV
jgi:hypothetical protein